MTEQGQELMDRADDGNMAPIGGTTARVEPGSDPSRTGGLGTPGAEIGVPTPGVTDPRDAPTLAGATGDVGMGGDAADVVTQVDGSYDATGGGTGSAGGLGGPNTIGGVGGSLGGISGAL